MRVARLESNDLQSLILKRDNRLSLWEKQGCWTGEARLLEVKWPPHSIQLAFLSIISVHAGFCFRFCCLPPLSGPKCICESGINCFWSDSLSFSLLVNVLLNNQSRKCLSTSSVLLQFCYWFCLSNLKHIIAILKFCCIG